jgi:hypothetical protein
MKGEIAELRNLGDGRTVLLYTNDNRVYRRLRDSGKLVKVVPYEQEQGGKVAMVGVDVYFPKEYRKWLGKNIGVHTQKVK